MNKNYFWGETEGEPSRLACCNSRSVNCCSRSISMMSGTTSTRNVVPAIHAAFPVLFRSFFVTKPASETLRFACWTIGDSVTLAIRLLSSPLLFLREWDAIVVDRKIQQQLSQRFGDFVYEFMSINVDGPFWAS